MTIITLTKDNFDTLITEQRMALVDFWAQWCGPCRVFDAVYEQVSRKYSDMLFGKVNIEEEPTLAEDFNIRTIPTLMIFRSNIAIFVHSGALTQPELEDVIQQASIVDVTNVRQALDAKP